MVTWVLNLDIPDDAERGTLAPLVRLLRDSPDNVALEAAEIDGWLQGQWKTDPKTLQDLIEQVLGHANLVGPLTPRVLLCIDETANTPLPKLAE